MWLGYGYLNSTEIWNNQRVMDYLLGDPANGRAGLALPTQTITNWDGCGTSNRLFCDPPLEVDGWRYTTPADDDAPWYDPLVPESADFAGLFVTEIAGFDSVVERTFNQGAIMGGSLGPLRLQGRTLTVTGWLRAKTCCAAEYGLSWLQEALIGGSGCTDCALGEMSMLKCCCTEDCPSTTDYIRYLEQVGLVDGPKVVERRGTCCAACGATNLKVQFTLGVQSPYIFSEVDWCAYQQAFPEEETWTCFYDGVCSACPEPVTTWQPSCGAATVTVPAPFLVDNNCYCDPWCAKILKCTFDNTNQWNDVTGYIEISTGSGPLKNLKVSGYKNPWAGQTNPDTGLPYTCDDYFADSRWKCAVPCAVLEVAELPAGAVLTIDSRTRTVALRLAGGTYVPGLRYISGAEGSPFDWFDIGYCTNLCVLISVDCSIASDATVSVGHVNKYLVSGG
jgi:hypothetical protein